MCIYMWRIFTCYIYTRMYIYIYMCIVVNISADLFHSESVLDCIVIPRYLRILQTPISPYCNTLQSPTKQFAIYLYCRVHLALLQHSHGIKLFRHRPDNFLARTASNPPETNEHQWKSMKTASLDAPGPQWQ